jgi:hypothetical protein
MGVLLDLLLDGMRLDLLSDPSSADLNPWAPLSDHGSEKALALLWWDCESATQLDSLMGPSSDRLLAEHTWELQWVPELVPWLGNESGNESLVRKLVLEHTLELVVDRCWNFHKAALKPPICTLEAMCYQPAGKEC